ncbi:MAG: hypothetical protein IJY09_06285 [Lachnospiraceae bacterium]|nr:hypothetical protein [Lachnospiraceae bacterium]
MKTEWNYSTKAEQLESNGMHYLAYGIFAVMQEKEELIYHDVTLNQEAASKLCGLLNREKLEPEQAKYVVEDYIMEQYLVCP